MNDDLSSAWTFVLKYVFPGIWIPGFGLGVVAAFRNPGDVLYNGVRGAAPPSIGFEFLGMWVLASAFILWISVPLKRVRRGDGALLVSNYITEWRVPFALVADVSQNRWVNVRPITIRLREDPGCGRKVVFMPPSRWRVLFWREDREVNELRSLAGLVRSEGGNS
jgi:hypothetical protein